ncbi:MAG: DUF4405 domain-containing protein [Desulfobulbaceae bacterium]|nr:MAG: DUF4405 domain-containing protein [Desulfobulbaceae bacterium]
MLTKNVSTTPVIAMFLILSATGVLLMLHAGGNGTKAIHEWLGVAFILFGVLHALANWNLTRRYLRGLKGGIIATAVIASLGLTGIDSRDSPAPPIKALLSTVHHAPLNNVAALYGRSPDVLAGQLQDNGYTVAGPDRSLEEIARDNGTDPDRLLAVLSPRTETGRH